jgi:hypothetical protein
MNYHKFLASVRFKKVRCGKISSEVDVRDSILCNARPDVASCESPQRARSNVFW